MSETVESREQALREWVEGLVGHRISIKRVPGGGRHEAWLVTDDADNRWFLRCDTAPPGDHEHYTIRREASIYKALHDNGLLAPDVLGVHPVYTAVVLENKEGLGRFAHLDTEPQTRIIDHFATVLGAVHTAQLPGFELDGMSTSNTIEDAVRNELSIWGKRIAKSQDPFQVAVYKWLCDNVPDTGDARAVLVQGDTGPGNFLHDSDSEVTSLLDFELAHFGDPMEDIAWVGTRNSQEPVPDFQRFMDKYSAASGIAIDRHRLRYHMLLAEWRIGALAAGREDEEDTTPNELAEHGNGLIYGALHRRLTVEAFAAVAQLDLPSVDLVTPNDSPSTYLYDGILAQLREYVFPDLDDAYALRRAKSLVRVVKYLREVDRVGHTHAPAELAEMTRLLGSTPSSLGEGRRLMAERVRDGSLDAEALLPYQWGLIQRHQQVVSTAQGVLATRHLPQV